MFQRDDTVFAMPMMPLVEPRVYRAIVLFSASGVAKDGQRGCIDGRLYNIGVRFLIFLDQVKLGRNIRVSG